jgi:glycine hydroxymethyltransferase
MAYQVDEQTGLVDFNLLRTLARAYRPKIIVAGASAYPRNWNYSKMKEVNPPIHLIFKDCQ